MSSEDTRKAYQRYIDCLNSRDWDNLHLHVAEDVEYNGKVVCVEGYRNMLIGDCKAIPDLFFNISQLVCDPPMIASRLDFNCTPVGELFDLPVNGRRVRFSENVFYELLDGKISKVWSVIDKAAIQAQI